MGHFVYYSFFLGWKQRKTFQNGGEWFWDIWSHIHGSPTPGISSKMLAGGSRKVVGFDSDGRRCRPKLYMQQQKNRVLLTETYFHKLRTINYSRGGWQVFSDKNLLRIGREGQQPGRLRCFNHLFMFYPYFGVLSCMTGRLQPRGPLSLSKAARSPGKSRGQKLQCLRNLTGQDIKYRSQESDLDWFSIEI